MQVVNIKRREDALNVYPDSVTNQSERPLSTTTDQKITTSTDTTDSAVTKAGNMIEAVVGDAQDFKDGQ